MIRTHIPIACIAALGALSAIPSVVAQSLDTPMTRLRPIGSPSAVDQYLAPSEPARFRETAYQQNAFPQQGQVRQAAMLQQMQAPQLPNSGQPPANFNPPQSGPNFALPPSSPAPVAVPQATAPRGLPNPGFPGNLAPVPLNQTGPISSSSDRSIIAPPQLHDGYATINDCNCISAPSSYTATSWVEGCTPVSYQSPQPYTAPPAEIAAPAILPGGVIAPAPTGVPASPLISFGQKALPLQIGPGLFGQPVAYVQGQRFRNWLRYIFP
jgi:hypothetical protein